MLKKDSECEGRFYYIFQFTEQKVRSNNEIWVFILLNQFVIN